MTEREQIEARVKGFPFWYHRIELPQGVVTPGWAPLDPEAYRIPDDLTGKRVLDVGAWDGYWTFEALRRGAREVLAIDDFSDTMGVLEKRDRKAWETFDLCRELLGYDPARCQRRKLGVYDVTEEEVGRFDVLFFFGTLYHLRYPQLALDQLGEICDDLGFERRYVLHSLRKYWASTVAVQGMDWKVMLKMFGHHDFQLILSTYYAQHDVVRMVAEASKIDFGITLER